MKTYLALFSLLISLLSFGQYPNGVGQTGTTAIHKDSSIIVNWANRITDFNRGLQNITNSGSGIATFGDSTNSLGVAQGTSTDAVSLGDNGSITLAFEYPIKNGAGPDFAIFENGFNDSFLELAHVEVSTDGITFIRIPSVSLTNTSTQTNSFGSTDPTNIHNLAGKYRQGYGTPFDLEDIIDSTGINLDSINFVKIIDVVGSIDNMIGSYDSQGNIINDPFPTEFESGGFDLDAIGVINENNIYAQIEELAHQTFNVYPNPTNTYFTLSSYEDCIFYIYDLRGTLIYSGKHDKEQETEIHGLSSGVYIIQLSFSDKNISKKLIVN